MPATRFGLYELLSPMFLAGFTFPAHIDRYLSILGVDTMRTAVDDAGVVYVGRVSFAGQGGAAPVREHRDPNGQVLYWEDVTLDFRLTVPRDGASFIKTAVDALAGLPMPQAEYRDLFALFGAVEQTLAPTEYPGVRFRLELLISALTFHLGNDWIPGKVAPDFRVIPDPDAGREVKIIVPKVVLEYEQGDDLSTPPSFRLKSWGNSGFDAPSDLAAGELVRMEPAIALHSSGRWGFSVEQIILDLSPDHTPPEILAFFGTDESFEGLFIKQLRLFWSDRDKDWAFNIAVRDALISFKGEVSLEASVDVMGPKTKLDVEVHFYEGTRDVPYTRGQASGGDEHNLVGGAATVLNTGFVQVHVGGGVPPVNVSVTLDGAQIWNAGERRAPLSPSPNNLRPAGTYALVVHVTDSGSGTAQKTFNQAITVTLRAASAPTTNPNGLPAENHHEQQGALPQAQFAITSTNPAPLPANFNLAHEPAASGTSETLTITGGNPGSLTATVDGAPAPLSGHSFTVEVGENQTRTIVVHSPAVPAAPETRELLFDIDKPDPEARDVAAIVNRYLAGTMSPPDTAFLASVGPLRTWIADRVRAGADAHFKVHAHASYQRSENAGRDQTLSDRRLAIAQAVIQAARPGASFDQAQAHGHSEARVDASPAAASWQVARVTADVHPVGQEATINATLHRDAREPVTPPPNPPTPETPNPPAPPPNRPPGVFRRIGVRLRLERNIPVLAEVRGELDFETGMERRLRSETGDNASTLPMQQQTGASTNASNNGNPEDGVVDFKLTVTYDTATRFLTETLSLGASPNDTDGLLRLNNPQANPRTAANVFKDTFGALLVFAPVTQQLAASLDPASAGDWAGLAVSFALPVALAIPGWFKATAVTLYGGELKLRQHVPGDAPVDFTDAGVVFDYGVEFGIDLPFPPIKSTRPLKVRYKAVGFNLHFPPDPDPNAPDVQFQPIFDTSKGYTIDLSDPGLFSLPAPFGDLLKILGARIARINPLVLDFDIGLKVDLGVVSVDKFKVTWPIEPLGAPRILPTGVKVDIPGTLAGKGSVDFREVPGGWAIKGELDVTIVPVKLRIAASLAVEPIVAGDRKVTAVFAGIVVEFPTPIVLGASGLGIFGFTGLFAMHYKRLEPAYNPTESVGPALKWLQMADGQPHKLTGPPPGNTPLWGPEIDRWSFGVGAILGTVEGGFLANLRGMLVLELPGPRILIMVKVQMVSKLPKLKDAGLTIGVLGVVDLDFQNHRITVGVIFDLTIENLIELKIPVELFFNLQDGKDWHLYLGTIQAMASAKILGLVRARGYFMIDGKQITGFPYQNGTITLPGIAVATGLEASILLGSESIGLYLKVSAGAHLGIAFSPFFIVGQAFLKGELRLFIISIEASGVINVRAPNPTLLDCHVCGKIDFFFFSIEGCVDFMIGSGSHNLKPPPLIRNVYLQSHAPVLVAGQGGERPIDATLGDAFPDGGTGTIPTVPIDSIPVIQFHAPPVVSGATTFTAPLVAPPNRTADDFIEVGGGLRAKYTVTSISLSPPISGPGALPTVWRPEQSSGPQGVKTNVDLALLSRVPTPGEHALERSNDLTLQVEQRWGGLCVPIAPPVCVLFASCGQRLGPSGSGWTLAGHPQPDPPGTRRTSPPPTSLRVDEPVRAAEIAYLDILSRGAGRTYRDPARVLGRDPVVAEEVCTGFSKETKLANPFTQDGFGFTVLSNGQPIDTCYVVVMEGIFGLHIATDTTIVLPAAADQVRLTIACFDYPAKVLGLDANNTIIAETQAKGDPKPEVVVLEAAGIKTVRLIAEKNNAILTAVCYTPAIGKGKGNEKEPGLDGCVRALQLPLSRQRSLNTKLPIEDKQLLELMAKAGDDRWLTFRTGRGSALVFMAVDPRLLKKGGLRVRQLENDGTIVSEAELAAINITPVTGTTTGLPATWLDPAGPWALDVGSAAQFLAEAQFAALQRFTFKLKLKAPRLQLYIPSSFVDSELEPFTPARAIVGALEVCPESESIRYQSETEVAQGELQTLTGYLTGGPPVALLAPNTLYTLTNNYDAVTRDKDGNDSTFNGNTQSFKFRTDVAPPKRIEPYVYGTTPTQGDQFHFYQDPVKVVFNDDAIVQMYQTYGKSLRFIMRGADGVPLPTHSVTDMDDVAAEFAAPYREALLAMLATNKDAFKCVIGGFNLGFHASWTSPVPLQPGMNYTFDIELDPADPVPPGAELKPTVPPIRRSFTTSRFPTLAALVAATRGRRILHRALTAPLGFVGSGEVELPDRTIEQILATAGEQALPAAGDTGFTIYWVFRPALQKFVPHAILVDAAEPLWRKRDEPTLETVPGQPDASFKRLVPATRPSLIVRQQGGAQIARFVHSPGGTRTIAVFADTFVPAPAGTAIQIVVERPASTLYGLTLDTQTLLQITLLPVAPWEEEP